jgi:hypothetical protein
MNQAFIAQAKELARQMKQARKSGDIIKASRLEKAIHLLNSYGQSKSSE